ncbi:MAG: 1-acyl-sn-glycerol-3-phosphate acyltransferase [Dysgonamonadaceae bacterium]|jgi:putative hemolysin|nr:1-acyl-sn-glycerol-3-phosphate acyltransferase [Dysgonamonadaceae bacterium]
MKKKMIGVKELQALSPIFKKPYGPFLAKCLIKIAGIDKANKVYDSGKFKTGTDIEDAMIDGLGIIRKVHNIDVLKQFEGKPFITVSNHPYGHVDGIMLVGEVCKIRTDFKVMVNWMLNLVDIMQEHFIGVNPYSPDTVNKSSLSGVKECLLHLKQNHPLGFFPAGAVSKNIGNNRIKDREWQEGVIKLIQKAQVPVIPVYISGQNSWFFNFLDTIDWRIRTVRLCHELTTKKGKTIHMVFGTPIFPDEQAQYKETKSLGEWLKRKTYELAATQFRSAM